MDLTDHQWRLLESLLPVPPVRDDGHGSPRHDLRDVLSGILWVLRTGAPWAEAGVMEQVLHMLAHDLKEHGGLDLTECFVDAPFASAKI